MNRQSNPTKPLLVIAGPTGSGKTEVAIEVAMRSGGEIVSCDSRQIYRHFTIGTAKPTLSQLSAVPHHMVDIVDPGEEFTAFDYMIRAREIIDSLLQRGVQPLLVGGTGLYIKAVLHGLFTIDDSQEKEMQALRARLLTQGVEALYEELCACDPESAAKVGPRDAPRIIRALAVFRHSGVTMSQMQRRHGFTDSPYKTLYLYLNLPRGQLYHRINMRVHKMMEQGWLEEVKRLLTQYESSRVGPMSSVGYRHLRAHLKGQLTLDEALRLIKRDTRRYAKKQLSWLRRTPEAIPLSVQGDNLKTIAIRIMLLFERFQKK